MATDLERLVAQLSADMRQYENAMKKASGIMNREARAIERRWQQAGGRLDAISAGMGRSLIAPLAGIGAALSVREVARYADAWTSAKNALAVAGVIGQNQADVLDRLYQSAQANAAPVTALADLFGKAAQASDNLGASQDELLQFSDGVATALRVQGVSATQASGALQQLGQLLGSARVQAEEFNSINEGARPILMAVAAGLDEAGGSVSKLKNLVNDGKVSGQQFFQAFLRGLPQIQSMAANATTTIEQGLTKVNNAFTRYIGSTDEGLGASQRLVQGLSALADNFDEIADITVKVAAIIGAGLLGRSIAGMVASLGLGAAAAGRFVAAMRTATTLAGVTTAISGLSAAAGPLGIVLGTTAAGALMLYSSSAEAAEEQSRALYGELEALGLIASPAAEAVAEVAAAVDDLGTGERLEKIRALREEIDRLRNGSTLSNMLSPDDAPRSLSDLAEGARQGMADTGWGGDFFKVDREALESVEAIAIALDQASISAEEAQRRTSAIATQDLSTPAKQLVADLGRTAEALQALETRQESLGDAPALQAATQQLLAMEEQLQSLLDMPGVDSKIVEEVLRIIDRFQDGEEGASDLQSALAAIGDADPNVAGFIQLLSPLFGTLEALRLKASDTAASLANVSGVGLSDKQASGYRQYQASRNEGAAMVSAGQSYLEEQQRLNGLTREQLALETEMTRVRKELGDAGGTATEAQIAQLARDRLAAQDGRRESGRKSKTEKDNEYESAMDSTERAIASMRAEAAALDALNGSYAGLGDAADYASKRAELIVAAQQAGLTMTPQLTAAIDEMARSYAESAFSADEAREALDRMKDASESGANAVAGIFTSVMSGARSAREAIADLLLRMAEVQAQNALLGLSGGGGVFGFLGGLLTPARRSRGGGVQAGVPYMVNEDTSRSEIMVPSESGGVLNVAQAQAALARSAGAVKDVSQHRAAGRTALDVDVRAFVDQDGNWNVAVERITDRRLRAAGPGLVNQSVSRSVAAVSKRSLGGKAFLGVR